MKYKPKKCHKKLLAAGFLSLLLIPVLIAANYILKSHPYFVEKYYSSTTYKYISGGYGFLTNLLPFSLIEVLIILLPIILIVIFIKAYRKASVTNQMYPLIKLLSFLCAAVTLMFTVYTCGLSFNYNRLPAGTLCNLNTSNPTKEELAAAFTYTVGKLNEVSKSIDFDENNISSYGSFFKMSEEGAKAFAVLSKENSVFSGVRVRAKPAAIFSIAMNYMGVTGVYSPFTNEANVNILFPDFSLPQTMCHELAHLRGFMREDEAEYVGFLACVKSSDIYFNYSAYMYAYNCIGNALYKTDKALYREIAKTAPANVSAEWKSYFDYADKFDGKITEIATKTNNSYLKSQGQSDGVISYSRAVLLVIGQMRKDNII